MGTPTRRAGRGSGRTPDYACPKCGSSEARRLSLIFRDAVSLASESLAPTRATGTSLTSSTPQLNPQLSRQAAPPSRKHDKLWIVAAVAAAIIATVTAWNPDVRTVASAAVVAVAVYFGIRSRRYNRDVFPRLHAQWEQSVMCGRCGNVYEVT
jgi:ribosomal protein L37AE/L43A